jgi:PAS domain S-box-containing protein
VSASPVHDTNGDIIGSVSVVRDITENKRAEAALQKSEEQYRTLFNTMTEGFCIIEVLFDEDENPIDYIFVEANPALEKQTRFSNVVGKRIRELYPAAEEYWLKIFGKVALTGESAQFENPLEALHRWYEVYAYRIGQPTSRKVAIILNEITERKKTEEALKESEEKYRNIVETANEGIYAVDAEAKITYVNSKLAEMLGYSLEECIGRPMWDFLSKENKDIVKLNLEKRGRGIEEVNEFKMEMKDGSPIWTLVNAKPLFDNDGKFIGAVCMLTDITERKEAEQALANIELARKKEIHHRIKNNLQVISSLLDLQAEKFKDRENIKDSEVLEAFRESQSRVISMALIHEELYRGGGFETLNFSAYIEELSGNLLSTYRLGNTDISLNLHSDPPVNFFIEFR